MCIMHSKMGIFNEAQECRTPKSAVQRVRPALSELGGLNSSCSWVTLGVSLGFLVHTCRRRACLDGLEDPTYYKHLITKGYVSSHNQGDFVPGHCSKCNESSRQSYEQDSILTLSPFTDEEVEARRG